MADGGFNNLVMTYVVPLVPYLLGLGVIALLLSLVVAWKRRW